MLVILDNCEQIVEHVAALSRDLLLACPNLHIVATSRERLAIAGEVVYRVPSLSLPPADVDAGHAWSSTPFVSSSTGHGSSTGLRSRAGQRR